MNKRRGRNEGTYYDKKNRHGKVIGVQAQLTIPGTKKRLTFSAPTKAELQRLMDEARQKLREGSLPIEPAGKTGDVIRETLERSRHHLKPRVHEAYELDARRLLPYIGDVLLERLRTRDIQAAIDALVIEGRLASGTIRRSGVVMHTLLGHSVRLGLIRRNPAEGLILPKAQRQEMMVLTAGQVALLLAVTNGDRFHAGWTVLVLTGIRVGELLGSKWDDVDWENRTITIQRSLQRQRGGGLVFVPPKTRHSRRTIVLPRTAIRALLAHRDRQARDRDDAGDDWSDMGLIFCTHKGKPLDRGRLHLHWKAALKKAELPNIRLHDLRHTAGFLMREQGVGIDVIQRTLGHSSIGVTIDVYGHISEDRRQDAADRLDDRFLDAQE